MNLKLARTNSEDPNFQTLVCELDAELLERNGELQKKYESYNQLHYLDTVIVAYDDDKPVGCGCFKPFSDSAAEIKRMYVKKEFRNRGISSLILLELELWALQHDFTKLILETGKSQHEAMQLYAKRGFKIIPNYGQYANMPNSICMQKLIVD